jgi:hypothetical protein
MIDALRHGGSSAASLEALEALETLETNVLPALPDHVACGGVRQDIFFCPPQFFTKKSKKIPKNGLNASKSDVNLLLMPRKTRSLYRCEIKKGAKRCQPTMN